MNEHLIVSAASEEFGPSLLALLGSLDLNWPGHPPVRVYDLGLDRGTRARLNRLGVDVRPVPAFVPHWRRHFTWKLWCLHDAPTRHVLWMDAGLVVLRPLDEIGGALERQGYFVTTNHELLDWEASAAACRGCGVPPDFRLGKLTLAGTLMGFRKQDVIGEILEEALAVASVEEHIAATEITHRHDQAILSLLAYKHLGPVVLADGAVYLGRLSPQQVPGQKVWVHRRAIRPLDGQRLAASIGKSGPPYCPTAADPLPRAMARAEIYKAHWCFGRSDREAAGEHLARALRTDPTLVDQPVLLGRLLLGYDRLLRPFLGPESAGSFVSWAVALLDRVQGSAFAKALESTLESSRRAERALGRRPAVFLARCF